MVSKAVMPELGVAVSKVMSACEVTMPKVMPKTEVVMAKVGVPEAVMAKTLSEGQPEMGSVMAKVPPVSPQMNGGNSPMRLGGG